MATEQVTRVIFSVERKLVVADPCYIDSEDLARDGNAEAALAVPTGHDLGCVFDRAQGEWEASVTLNRENRVATLSARRVGALMDYGSREIVNPHIGVDSGQMLIGCVTSSFGLDYNELLKKYSKSGKRGDEPGWGGDDYNGLLFFSFGEAAVSSTGYGDGSYPVELILCHDGRPASVTVNFLADYDEEDEDERW